MLTATILVLLSSSVFSQQTEFEVYTVINNEIPFYSNKIYFTPKLMTIEQWGVSLEDPYRGEHFVTLLPTNKKVSRALRKLDKSKKYECHIFGDLLKLQDNKQVHTSEVKMTTYEVKDCKVLK